MAHEFVVPTHVCLPKQWEGTLEPRNGRVALRYCSKWHCALEALFRRQYAKNRMTMVTCNACRANWARFVASYTEHMQSHCILRISKLCGLLAADSSPKVSTELDELYQFDYEY